MSEPTVETAPEGVRLSVPGGSVTLGEDAALALAASVVEAAVAWRAAQEGGEADPEGDDSRRVPVQFLRLTAVMESEDDPEAIEEAAEVLCWVTNQTRTNALYVAVGWAEAEGWAVDDVLEQRDVTRADFADTEYEAYYTQALTDGEVFLFEVEDDGEGETAEEPA